MRILILVFTIYALVACSGSEEPEDSVEAVREGIEGGKVLAASETTKTGAAVMFASDFAGSLSVGEMASMVIHLRPEYESGQIQVNVQGQDGLTVVGETQFSERFSGDYQFTHELMVGADRAGEYYLGVVANVITDSGEETARAFSETVLVVEPLAALAEKATESVKNTVESVTDEAFQESEVLESFVPAVEEIIAR